MIDFFLISFVKNSHRTHTSLNEVPSCRQRFPYLFLHLTFLTIAYHLITLLQFFWFTILFPLFITEMMFSCFLCHEDVSLL